MRPCWGLPYSVVGAYVTWLLALSSRSDRGSRGGLYVSSILGSLNKQASSRVFTTRQVIVASASGRLRRVVR